MSTWRVCFSITYSIPHITDNAVYALKEPIDEVTYEVPNGVQISGQVHELEGFPAPRLPPVDYGEYAEPKDFYHVLVSREDRATINVIRTVICHPCIYTGRIQ